MFVPVLPRLLNASHKSGTAFLTKSVYLIILPDTII